MALTKVSKNLVSTDTVLAVDAIGANYGSTSAPVTIAVTVASKTAAHPYNGDGSGNGYYLDGVEAPAIQLHGADNVTSNSEYIYRFDQSDSSNSGHPFRFYLDADKTTAFTTGVTTNGTAGSSGAYTQIAVTEDTPSIIYYQCSSHAYMGNYATVPASNKINHSEALIDLPTATTTLVGTNTTDTLTNKTISAGAFSGVSNFQAAITEQAVALTSGTSVTLDISAGSVFTITLAHNIGTFTWSNPATSGDVSAFVLKVTQDGTGNRTIAFPASVDFAGGTAPTLSSGANDVDIFVFVTSDGGTTYFGFTAGQDMS